MRLKQTPPEDAKNRYLKDKKPHVSKKTLSNYTTALNMFCKWLHSEGITDLGDLDSDEIQRYKEHRLDNVKPITARNDMRTVKNFVQFCESIQAVPQGLSRLVRIPKVSEDDEICDDLLTREEAVELLDYLRKYEYASIRHVTILILWKTGMRMGGLRSLDLEDFDEVRPALQLRHRADTATPLKRKEKSQRDVLISSETADVISDFIKNTRPNVTDEYDREPLIATNHGRIAETSLQRYVYTATRPCHYTGGCPFDRDPEECNDNSWNGSSACPGSVSPHALRRGYVTAARNAGQPKDVTGERVNMSGKVLDKHYDKGSFGEKAERRRGHLREI